MEKCSGGDVADGQCPVLNPFVNFLVDLDESPRLLRPHPFLLHSPRC